MASSSAPAAKSAVPPVKAIMQPPAPNSNLQPAVRSEPNIHVEITYDHLNSQATINRVKSPKAGAVVLFAGTTRDSFNNLPVSTLAYESYTPLALNTLFAIATGVRQKYGLEGVCIMHRLGEVPINEESILIAVSAPHRHAAWRAGEEALEETKKRAEIWKLEKFENGHGVWRANRDGQMGVRVDQEKAKPQLKESDGCSWDPV